MHFWVSGGERTEMMYTKGIQIIIHKQQLKLEHSHLKCLCIVLMIYDLDLIVFNVMYKNLCLCCVSYTVNFDMTAYKIWSQCQPVFMAVKLLNVI